MKKYILFIVEGKNDKIEIQAMLRAYCKQSLQQTFTDEYLVYDGDITVDCTEKTIVGTLTGLVQKWRKGGCEPFHTIAVSDVDRIIHVVDTDGVFIPDDDVLQDDVGNPEYTDTTIKCGNRAFIIGRNRKKAKVLLKLLTQKKIDNIPYELRFASCNMDHVLFNTQNPKAVAKGPNARMFAMKYKEKDDLKNKVFANGVGFTGDYGESWVFIQQDHNSLHRHTNINMLLETL